MGRRKFLYVLPHLNDAKGNLSAQWYVEYSCRNNRTEKLERFRIYEGLNCLTKEERLEKADKIIKHFTKLLLSGWTPFAENKEVITNHILYNSEARILGTDSRLEKNMKYYINVFLDNKISHLKHKSQLDYKSKLRLFYLWIEKEGLGNLYPIEITREIILKYIQYLISVGQAKVTIKKTKQHLRQLFEFLIEENLIDQSPVFNLPDGLKVPDMSAQPMTAPEASELLSYIKSRDEQTFLFCSMIFYCAIRPGTELRMLKVKDINLFSKTIRIREENSKTTEGVINMPPPLVEILEEYKINRHNREFYVFSKNGEPGSDYLGKNYFRLKFNKYRDEIGFPEEYKLYSWKCTGAILFAMNGAPLPAVRDHLRHKHTATTDVYLS